VKLQAKDQQAGRRLEEITQALHRTLAERDEALCTLQQLTSAYADLLASSTKSSCTAVEGAALRSRSPDDLSTRTSASAAASAFSHTVCTHTQTDPLGMRGVSGTASWGERRDAGAQTCLSEPNSATSVAAGGSESVAMTTGVTKTLLEMQRRCEQATAAERDALAHMHEVQGEAKVARRARRDAEVAYEAARREVEEVQNLLEDHQKLLDDAVREKEFAQSAKEKAEERLSRLQVILNICYACRCCDKGFLYSYVSLKCSST
jgi:exonuclease VII small subunit